jgi:glycosyltransferase involved in cell wall biosynthesis
MSAFDAFLLPSLYEGLGIVLIEAQAASLQCITTYEYVPKDTNITPYITYVSLDAKDSEWAKKMVSASFLMERRNMVPEIVASGYDINEEAHRLFDFYNNKR